jgi:hypothetical protein
MTAQKNRLAERISLLQARIDAGEIEQEKLDKLEESLKTDTSDLIQYQDLQALAHASGVINFEEAQQIYRLLGGEAPAAEKWDQLSIPEKVAVTQMMDELLDWRLSQRPGWQARTTRRASTRPAAARKEPTKPEGLKGLQN